MQCLKRVNLKCRCGLRKDTSSCKDVQARRKAQKLADDDAPVFLDCDKLCQHVAVKTQAEQDAARQVREQEQKLKQEVSLARVLGLSLNSHVGAARALPAISAAANEEESEPKWPRSGN